MVSPPEHDIRTCLGSPRPLQPSKSLDNFQQFDCTPSLGTEYSASVSLKSLLNGPDRDRYVQDLALQVSQRGVVFFRDQQDLSLSDQKELCQLLGQMSGKPACSGLYVDAQIDPNSADLGDDVTIISSMKRTKRSDSSMLASKGWHADITFEPVPSDYAILKLHTIPRTGGDTLWASGYEVYDRMSPSFAKYLETLSAIHDASEWRNSAKVGGQQIREGVRGSPHNSGDSLEAIHPVVRTNPVTGWKSIFVNPYFTKRILGVTRDESDALLGYIYSLIHHNHDLQVRYRWNKNDVAIWDNRVTLHTATFDYDNVPRQGNRVVSLGEKPYLDPRSLSRREALDSANITHE